MPTHNSFTTWLWKPHGAWHMRFITRCYAYLLMFLGLGDLWDKMAVADSQALWGFIPTPHIVPIFLQIKTHLFLNDLALALAGLLLFLRPLARGPLLVATAVMAGSFWGVLASHGASTPGVEWPLYVGFPAINLLFLMLHPKVNDDLVVDSDLRSIWRLVAALTLFFIAFHKWNVDHLLEGISCGSHIMAMFSSRWPAFGTLIGDVPPALGVIWETVVIVALFFYRRIASILIIALTVFFAMYGAFGVASMVAVLTCAFLSPHDEVIAKQYSRPLLWIGIGTYMLFVSLASAFHIDAPLKVITSPVCFALFGYIIALQVLTLWHSRHSSSPTETLFPLPSNLRMRIVTIVSAILFFINCMSPYLGLKFHYSLSMFSNLRVDAHYWNHLVVPRWFQQLSIMPHYVVITALDIVPTYQPSLPQGEVQSEVLAAWIDQLPTAHTHTQVVIRAGNDVRKFNSSSLSALRTLTQSHERFTVEFAHSALQDRLFLPVKLKHLPRPGLYETTFLNRLLKHSEQLPLTLRMEYSYGERSAVTTDAARDAELLETLEKQSPTGLFQSYLSLTPPQRCEH